MGLRPRGLFVRDDSSGAGGNGLADFADRVLTPGGVPGYTVADG